MSGVNVDGLLLAIVRPALAPAKMFSRQPSDLLTDMPCGVVKHIPGGSGVDPRFSASRVTVQLDGYASSKHDAFDLAVAIRDALVAAWQAGTRTDFGVIARVLDAPDPAELRLPDQADGFTRYTSTASLIVR